MCEREIHVHYDAGDEAQAVSSVVRRRGTRRRGACRRRREVLEVGYGQVDVGVALPLAEQSAGTLVALDAVFLGRSSLDFHYTCQFFSNPKSKRGESFSAYVVSIGIARPAEHDVGLDGAERLGDGGGLDGASPPAARHGGGCWEVLAMGSKRNQKIQGRGVIPSEGEMIMMNWPTRKTWMSTMLGDQA